jgi:hypothetical protein
MTLPAPNLDDRTFVDLVTEARQRIAQTSPEWTDLSVHDPGMTLVEVFAHLTEVMLYRLNRLPNKAYVEFLNLLAVAPHPPAAGWVDLTFSRVGEATERIAIPAGTRVATSRGTDRPVAFTVIDSTAIEPGTDAVTVRAHHCELVAAELLGTGTGAPGQVLRVRRPPIVATTESVDVVLGVEVTPGTLPEGAAALEHDGQTYEIWQPTATFAGVGPADKVYLLERGSGTVTFAPALDLRGGSRVAAGPSGGGTGGDGPGGVGMPTLAAVPPAGRQIRIWYRTGGGMAGNVAAGTLTTLRDPIPGVKVHNQSPARGGREPEPVQAAIARGPYEFFSLHRAVTTRDFELLATAGSAGIARAKAFTRTGMWCYARPGEVEVVLVPHVDTTGRPGWRLPVATLVEHQVEPARLGTEQDLDGRRALGTSVAVTWARYKAVSVRGRVVVRPQEDPDTIRERIHDRLYQTISPLATPLSPAGMPFGAPLRASNIYRLLEQAEPGVRYVADIRFVVEQTPDQRVRAVAADNYQAGTWYAGCDETVFRSTNGGRGWEPVGDFPGEQVRRVVPAPAAARPGETPRPGALAVVTRDHATAGSSVYVSRDLGYRWEKVAELDLAVADLAWIDRDDQTAALLLATDSGLFEVALLPGAVPLQVLVDETDPGRGFYAVASFVSERGGSGVAVAAQARYGVYLSTGGGRSGSFANVGLSGMDSRTLAVQYDGPATLLWVGTGEADPNRPGRGCRRARLFEANVRWEPVSDGWAGGTCWDLAFAGNTVVAATQSGGALWADASAPAPQWSAATVNSGLPLRDRTRFEPVESAAATADGQVLVGTTRGVYAATAQWQWAAAATREKREVVTIPETWLLCSGDHDIEVVRDDA